ncbi:MAG: zinc-dependent metalloprotease [Candidatus Marinimicrobia bacterium]|nr:zinc-dependent metalloprotease [Candidatus Neomarinimicrobiota bacterium]
MSKRSIQIIWTLIFFGFYGPLVFAEEADKNEKADADTLKKVTIESVAKSCKKFDGLFTTFQDTTNGSVYFLFKEDQIGKEFIYFVHTVEGVVDVGHFRGAYRGNKIFSVEKYFDRIELVTQNTAFYFDENNPLSRAAEANISQAIIASQKIVATDEEKGEYLVKMDDVFLTESLQQVKPSPDPDAKPGERFTLGNLNKDKSKYVSIKNYPLNTDIIVQYVYDNPAPSNRGGGGVTDPRSVSVSLQHSFIEVPQNNFKPRFDDPRVGYFTTRVTDMTSTSVTPYHDPIDRWHLEKSDSNAILSEPKEPIVWWIENTTPHEFRDAVAKGVLAWNNAFEAAGFRNAVQVRVQPDDADWDAEDIRYNVLRWTSSPNPPFGGYGPSFVNPRTGQILGADIMLEWIYFTNRVRYSELYTDEVTRFENGMGQFKPDACLAGEFLHQSNLFGGVVLGANGSPEEEKQQLIEEALMWLVLHEVGHTLGLMHNFKSSQLHSIENIHNKSLTKAMGLIGSVMDYPAINVALSRDKQGQYYSTRPGPYDVWAIEYGYTPTLDDHEAEVARQEFILVRSTEPELAFGNDADDMRRAGRGIDPRIMIYDMSNDAISYAIDRIKLSRNLMNNLKDKYSIEGQSYHALNNAFRILLREHALSAGIVSRYIGGVHIDRAFAGQEKAGIPLMPVEYNLQKRAMETLEMYLFSPDAFEAPEAIYNYLQIQRRGFNFFLSNEDPKIHEQVLSIHKSVLNHLLNPTVLKRISDSELYGNQYKLTELMSDLTRAVFKADARGEVNTFRQNLQTELVNRLINMMESEGKSSYDYLAQSVAFYNLKKIKKMINRRSGVSESTVAHREHLMFKIQKTFSES